MAFDVRLVDRRNVTAGGVIAANWPHLARKSRRSRFSSVSLVSLVGISNTFPREGGEKRLTAGGAPNKSAYGLIPFCFSQPHATKVGGA